MWRHKQVKDAAAVQTGSDQAFQGGMDVQQRVAEPVGQTSGLGSEVVVVAGEHGELGEGFIVGADPAQGMGHGPSGVGDDVGVAGVGLAFTGVQVGDAASPAPAGRQCDAQRAGDRDRQRADRGRLIDDHQDRPVFAEAGETPRPAPPRRWVAPGRAGVARDGSSAHAWCSALLTSRL